MKILRICPDSWGSNCYLAVSGSDAYVIDPSPSVESIINMATAADATVRGIVLTHGHFDHVISAEALHKATCAPVMIHREDADALADPVRNAYLSFFGQERRFAPAQRTLEDGDVLPLGAEKLTVLHTPGHTPGSICLLCDDFVITGDTLFESGFGRVDLAGGSLRSMKASLERLNLLDHSLPIYPGHNQPSTLGDALKNIHFLKPKTD